jgi:hypothetical protein
MSEILIQVIDSAGNVGYIYYSSGSFTDSVSALEALNALPTGHYMAQIVNGNQATVLAVI